MVTDYLYEISKREKYEIDDDYTAQYYRLSANNKKERANEIREKWKNENRYVNLKNKEIGFLKLMNNYSIDLSILPEYSFIIQFEFTLEKPYISKDDQEFYIIDNPIKKDKVFGLPFVAPSSWKGSLRSALYQKGRTSSEEPMIRIFGNDREVKEQEDLHAGRLYLYPTFFTEKSLEIINPHDRKRKVGKNPILIESVGTDALGTFTLLYVPFDFVNDHEKILRHVKEDIEILGQGLKGVFREFGFGAKTSSGYGITNYKVSGGKIKIKTEKLEGESEQGETPEPPEERFEKYLDEDGVVKEEFKGSGEGGLLSNTEYSKSGEKAGGGSLKEFKKFKSWYNSYGETWQRYIKSEKEPSNWPFWKFNNFDELVEKMKMIGDKFAESRVKE